MLVCASHCTRIGASRKSEAASGSLVFSAVRRGLFAMTASSRDAKRMCHACRSTQAMLQNAFLGCGRERTVQSAASIACLIRALLGRRVKEKSMYQAVSSDCSAFRSSHPQCFSLFQPSCSSLSAFSLLSLRLAGVHFRRLAPRFFKTDQDALAHTRTQTRTRTHTHTQLESCVDNYVPPSFIDSCPRLSSSNN